MIGMQFNRKITSFAAALAIGALCLPSSGHAVPFSVTLGSGLPKDTGSQFGASLAGTVLKFTVTDNTHGTLEIDLKNGGLGTVTEFDLALNESKVSTATYTSQDLTGCTGGTNVCNWDSHNNAPTFNDSGIGDGFQSAAVTHPFDIGVGAHGNSGLQSAGSETAKFFYDLTGTGFNSVSSFFDIMGPFDESSGTAHLKNVFWVAHVQQVDSAEGSIWIGGVVSQPAVPEPATLTLFGAALLGLGLVRRRQARA